MKSVELTQGDLLGSSKEVSCRTRGRKLMTQKKSEYRIVPEDGRKAVQTPRKKATGGGKAIPANKETYQMELPFATAENLQTKVSETERCKDKDLSLSERHKVPKAKINEITGTPATIERVIERLSKAFAKVAPNKGAPGPDGQTVEMVRANFAEIHRELKRGLEKGTYKPQQIKRVYIPKPGGKGQRGLGIPNVVDRILQEAIRQVLEPLYEPEFHPSSHGFRPGRGCHTAMTQAKQYVEEGFEWVVDTDLAKYFDTVNHQRLMAKLESKVKDQRLLKLIWSILKAKVIMPEGVVVRTEEGVPQGGPLSPLLSNIVLDELDRELE